MIESLRTMVVATALLVAGLLFAAPLRAATQLEWVSVSPDVTVELNATTFDDEDVAVDNLSGVVVAASLGSLPESADVTAYHLFDDGDQLLSFDTTVTLPGSVTAEPGDVVRYDGAIYVLEFDASLQSIPNGVITDAVSTNAGGDLLISFDTTVELAAVSGTITVDDEDLVLFNGSSFSLVIDGSAAGVPGALDLDGVHDLGNGKLALSFDGSGQLGGVDFDDEDVLEFDPSGPTWAMLYDGSAQHATLAATDADAISLPEPGAILSLAAGITFLAIVNRRQAKA
jgi:hypothetical protein